MQTYVSLFNFTKQGLERTNEMPEGIEGAIERLEEMGGNALSIYVTMGAHDFGRLAGAQR